VYENAHSTTCWTPPAHASLFTGLYPVAHGTTQEKWTVNWELETLAEVLAGSGYETAAIVENPMLVGIHGYKQGFSVYHETWRRKAEPTTENLALDLYIETLDGRDPERPFFLFVNLIEPHSPYNSSGPFYDRFLTDSSIDVEGNGWRGYYVGRREFTDAEVRVLFTDHLVGRMEDHLRSRGLWDRTLFLVTSDHGENIGDHDHMDHVFSLYETTTQIPLVIHYPPLFRTGYRDPRPVQINDVFPTLLTVAGIDPGLHPSQGMDLLRDGIPEDRPILCEYYFPRQALQCYRNPKDRENPRLAPYKRRIRSLEQNGWKLVWGSDGQHELYDLTGDAFEETNLLQGGGESKTARRLEGLLSVLLERRGRGRPLETPPPPDSLDSDTREALRSLGYL